MSDFPELQHALVDAAGRRYRRGARTWRVVRPVAVAAVCAAAAVAVVTIADTTSDERSVNPPAAGANLTSVEQDFAVFRRPMTAADELPDAKVALQDWTPTMDGNREAARKVVDDGRWQVFLSAGQNMVGPAVCATAFYDGKLQPWSNCTAQIPRSEVDPRMPLANGWLVADYSFPPTETDPGAFAIIVPDGVDEVTYTYADGAEQSVPVRDNTVFVSPIERWPRRLSWVYDGRPQSSSVERLGDFGRHIDVRPGFGE